MHRSVRPFTVYRLYDHNLSPFIVFFPFACQLKEKCVRHLNEHANSLGTALQALSLINIESAFIIIFFLSASWSLTRLTLAAISSGHVSLSASMSPELRRSTRDQLPRASNLWQLPRSRLTKTLSHTSYSTYKTHALAFKHF